MKFLLTIFFIFLFSSTMFANETEDWGPLSIRSQAPLVNSRLGYIPGRFSSLELGKIELSNTITHVNLWGREQEFLIDIATTRFTLNLNVGLGNRWEFTSELPILWRSGGFLDNFIDSFHQEFGFARLGRNIYPQNQVRVEVRNPETIITLDHGGWGLANPVLGLRKQLTYFLTFETKFKIPIGTFRNDFATSGFEVLFDLRSRILVSNSFYITIAVGLTYAPNADDILGFQTKEIQKFGLFGFQVKLKDNLTFALQYLRQDGIAKSRELYSILEKSTNEFAIGFKWKAVKNLLFEFAFIENAINDSNTPDIGIHFGITINLE